MSERYSPEIHNKLRDLGQAVAAHQAEAARIAHEIAEIKRHASGEPSIYVSDHAVLRWLERRSMVDVAAVRQELAAAVAGHATRKGVTWSVAYDGAYLIGNGASVLTALTAEQFAQRPLPNPADAQTSGEE